MARVTIYLSDELHRRWRKASWINLSKLAARALTETLDRDEDEETVYLCDMCQRRVGRALEIRIGYAPDPPKGAHPVRIPAAGANGSAA